MPTASTTQDIRHTRLEIETNIVHIKPDEFNPINQVVSFIYTPPDNYFLKDDLIPYAIYVDRELYEEFFGKEVKVQMQIPDVVHILETYALPHFGFIVERGQIVPGNKIRIKFRGKNAEAFDVTKYIIKFDNKTGTIIDDPIGTVDAITGRGGCK